METSFSLPRASRSKNRFVVVVSFSDESKGKRRQENRWNRGRENKAKPDRGELIDIKR